jgi:murein DD-endopeptidase MepM/ murein hydrolase activator NlpD
VRGTGDDAGLDIDYSGVGDVSPVVAVQRGDVVAHVTDAAAGVTIHALLDGRPLDVGPLLRSAMSGTPDVTGGWTRPVHDAVVSQDFGCTPYSFEPLDRSCSSGHIHTGIDLAVPLDTSVCAALDGIAHVIDSAGGYGLHVVIDSGDGLTTFYGHLHSVAVREGDEVNAGDVIGAAGSSGNSTGPHLHFEVRRDGIPEDPTLDVALP